jgi:ribonuclease BN (tRNA processing enzyme)
MSTFKELERLNAHIDIWIDEEEYGKVIQALPLAKRLESGVNSCFEHPNCTQDKDSEWDGILYRLRNCPIPYAYHQDLTRGKRRLNKHWSRLFYAKLLRARIQEKGTDCYFKRLDEVVAYLENHIPTISDENTAKLTILYLLELAATSESFEILGFAERARRAMTKHKSIMGKDANEFFWFYDLLARYNIGLGHFHKSRYRKAILEFNYIIEQVQKEENRQTKETKNSKLDFLKWRHGYPLLYLSAVLYRADVQLRLQLAYHAHDTIVTYLKPREEISVYKELREHLIETEAHQQMGRLGEAESWKHLSNAYSLLITLDNSPNKPQELTAQEEPYHKFKERTSFMLLPFALFKGQRQNIKGQFLHFYIEDHLEWLEKFSPTTDGQNRIQGSKMLSSMFGPRYFKLVQLNARNRNGYFQQLAKFMAWLAKEPELRVMAKKLYEHRGVQMLEESSKVNCSLCTSQGVDLKSMNPQYYSWFKDKMLKFLEAFQKSPAGNKEPEQSMEHALEEFGRIFIKQERDREDLRIADLDLRYKLGSVRKQLQMGHDLCHTDDIGAPLRLSSAFHRLLDGAGSDEQSDDRRDFMGLNSEDYQRIMSQWDAGFLRRLRSNSNQGGHKRGLYLIGLQRWNSSSPAQGRSIGGGYLLYHTDKSGTVDLGIAIDPGFDFVRNLFHEGFGISDIDIVLISHSHVDHVRDFEVIVQLLTDLKKLGNKREKCIHVMLSLGVYERLKHIIEDPFYRYHVEPYIIDVRREIERNYFEKLSPSCAIHFVEREDKDKNKRAMMRYEAVLPDENLASQAYDSRIKVTVQPTRAYHTDPSNYSDSFGFKIEVTEPGEKTNVSADVPSPHTTILGYTGDTKWVYPHVHDPLEDLEDEDNRHQIWDVSEQYFGCDAVIVHLGSLVDTDEKGLRKEFMNCLKCEPNQQEECRGTVCKKDHPYLAGLIRLLSSLRSESRVKRKTEGKLKQLILVSEFGEELRGGIRVNLIERLKLAYKDALSFLPIDVGMDVQLLPREKREDDNRVASNEQKVWCIQCEQFVAIDAAKFERYGVDEALFCFCETCRKATPLNVMQDRMRQLYEVGRDLRTLDE